MAGQDLFYRNTLYIHFNIQQPAVEIYILWIALCSSKPVASRTAKMCVKRHAEDTRSDHDIILGNNNSDHIYDDVLHHPR